MIFFRFRSGGILDQVQTSDRQVPRLSNMGRHACLRHNDVQLVRDGTVKRRGKHLLLCVVVVVAVVVWVVVLLAQVSHEHVGTDKTLNEPGAIGAHGNGRVDILLHVKRGGGAVVVGGCGG